VGDGFASTNVSEPCDLCGAFGAVVHVPWLERFNFWTRDATVPILRSYFDARGSDAIGVGRSLRNTREAASPKDCQFSSAGFDATGNATTSALTDALGRNGDDAGRTGTGGADANSDALLDATWNIGLLVRSGTQGTDARRNARLLSNATGRSPGRTERNSMKTRRNRLTH
jgi:hypothetical protein